MGTINYKTSNYITMGTRPESVIDYESNAAIMEEIKEIAEENGTTPAEEIERAIALNEEADHENAAAILEKYNFYYFHVAIIPGYYESFYIDIENNFSYFYDNAEEKREAYKETAEIKKFLIDLAGCGLVSVFPAWCTTYRDYKQTLKDIKKAVAEMRAEIKQTPTYRTLHAAGEI